ncbi:MAG: (Fe-S)-binding protein [Candidatus Hodarchaeota archaeon]
MISKDKLIEDLKHILKEDQVLTDFEDRYVYSFEKVFLNRNDIIPDIIIRVCSIKEENKIKKLAEQKNLNLYERGKDFLGDIGKSSKPRILLDNAEIPKLDTCFDNVSQKGLFADLYKFPINGYGTFKHLSLAVQKLLFGKTLNQCQQCTTCSGYCTVNHSFYGIETWSSKGRLLLTRGILRGDLVLSDKIVDVIYNCTKCGLCFAQCFQNLEFHDAILYLRHKIAEKNLVPQIFHTANNNILKYGDPSAIPSNRRLTKVKNYIKSKLPENAKNLCWLGCTVATRTPKTAESLINILNHMKLDYTMLGNEEGCCGYVLISSGLWEEAKRVAEGVIERIAKTKAKSLITPCSGCYYTFTRLFPEILDIEIPCKILHTSQFLEKAIKNEEFNLKPLKFDVTYHDPCSLGRHSQIYDQPRNVLKAIPSLNLIEMPLNKNCARCCGGGGGLWSFNNKVSLESTQTRLKEDLPKNVNILTTACPQCQLNFRFASHTGNSNYKSLKIYDITELIDLALQSE